MPSIVETETVNVSLLRKAVEWAEAEASRGADSQWDQTAWVTTRTACGTAFCIAGWVLHESGWTEADLMDDDSDVATAASEALGIDPDRWAFDDDHLFDTLNSIEDVRRIAEDLAGERL